MEWIAQVGAEGERSAVGLGERDVSRVSSDWLEGEGRAGQGAEYELPQPEPMVARGAFGAFASSRVVDYAAPPSPSHARSC